MIGAGNGTPGPISGYHSGQIGQMSATHVHCSSIVVVSWPAGAIVSAIELDSDAAHWEGGCTNNDSKAIRDGKYLALPYSSAWRRSPIKINKFVFVRYVISLLAQVFIFLIDRATHEKYRPFTC